jgi:hypothetical protein
VLRHVVLLKFVDEATPEQRQAVLDGLATLPPAIPAIRSYRFGLDAAIAEGNHDLAVVADFDDVDGYREYAAHPLHQQVIAERIRPILSARAAVQHEH